MSRIDQIARQETAAGQEKQSMNLTHPAIGGFDAEIERKKRRDSRNGSGWYGIRCLTGRETEVQRDLECIGVDVISLSYRTRTWPRKKRKSIVVERALCPGYVFAFIVPEMWQAVRSCRRVIGWVSDGSGPLAVSRPDDLMKFRNAALAGAYDDKAVEGRLRPGDELEVLFGPLAGWRVAFMALKGSYIESEISLMGAARRVLLPTEIIHMKKG